MTTSFISVIIPAYNEETSLGKVLADLPQDQIQEVIVVNNNSTDRTATIAHDAGAKVINEPQRGYGQACLTGIAALNRATTIVVFIDGDYSDHGEQMPKLIQPIENDQADMIIGSRTLGQREKGSMTPQAYWGNKLACFLMHQFWKYRYTDLGPFRAIRYEALKELNMSDKDFGWTIEMQIKAITHGLRIQEIPVDYRCRIGKSKISGTIVGTMLASKKILQTIFKYKFLNQTPSQRRSS